MSTATGRPAQDYDLAYLRYRKGRRDTAPSGFDGEYFRETADEARAIRHEIDELLALARRQSAGA